MVAILNFMYRGEVNVNQEDLQNFLAAAEELRIKGLSQASNDSKLEKLENSVPKMKQVSGGSSNGQPPAKKPRESSPGKITTPPTTFTESISMRQCALRYISVPPDLISVLTGVLNLISNCQDTRPARPQ